MASKITQRFTLTKAEKLKSRKLIEQLFREGKSFSFFPLKVLYLLPENGYVPLQSGFTASKKKFKKAVDRNRIKRLIREAYRLQKSSLIEKLINKKKCMLVFFIYTGDALPGYEVIFDKINLSLIKLQKIVDESVS